MNQPDIVLKRIYDDADPSDGVRVLVDRLWPRGVSKTRAQLDHWLPQIAPSTQLRTWWDHDPPRFAEFRRRYEQELDDEDHADAVATLLRILKQRRQRVTLLFGAKDEELNQAVVLKGFLERQLRS